MTMEPDFTRIDYREAPERPTYDDWRTKFEAEVGRPPEDAVLGNHGADRGQVALHGR